LAPSVCYNLNVWFIFQAAVIFVVTPWVIAHARTIDPRPSGYTVGIIVVLAAWGSTKLLAEVIDSWRWFVADRRLRRQRRAEETLPIEPPCNRAAPQLQEPLRKVRRGEYLGEDMIGPPP
jgi:hypothetical protein